MNITRPLGFWPFDSEQDKNLGQAVAAAAVKIKDRVMPQLSLVQKAAWTAVDFYRDPWEQFVENYMAVARALGRGYTSNADYYTAWEPRMLAFGWDKGILEKLMAAMRTLGSAGAIPREVLDPAHNQARGTDGSPIGALGTALQSGLTRVAIIVAVGYFGFRYLENVTVRGAGALARRKA